MKGLDSSWYIIQGKRAARIWREGGKVQAAGELQGKRQAIMAVTRAKQDGNRRKRVARVVVYWREEVMQRKKRVWVPGVESKSWTGQKDRNLCRG